MEENMTMIHLQAGKCACLLFIVFAVALTGCATASASVSPDPVPDARPLTLTDLDRIGWEQTASFQCYLSSPLTLTKLPDNSLPAEVNFDAAGSVRILETRGTIVLPSSLAGRIIRSNKRDLYLYVAFEEGDAALPFARDKNDQFSLMPTIDSRYQNGVEFVEYEGVRYSISAKPHLNVVINETQADLRRQMGGSEVRAVSKMDEVVERISAKFIVELPASAVIAVLNISSSDKAAALFIIDELEFHLSESKRFKIVDRNSLDAIRVEQQFQASGDVSDESAHSIGNMLGANIVITGNISGTGTSRRVTLKALDVETAEIISTAREAF
jgi:TolB-like protein